MPIELATAPRGGRDDRFPAAVALRPLVRQSDLVSHRAEIEAAWCAIASSVGRQDAAAAAAAIAPAVRQGLLQTAGPAALVALQSGQAKREVEPLLSALQQRAWPGDAVLVELVSATALGAVTARRCLTVDLDMIGDLLCDESGGFIDLETGAAWPLEIAELGEVDGLEPYGDHDPELWLDVPGYGSRDAYTDMADFTADLADPRVRDDLAASLEGRGAFRRFQDALNRHEVYRVHWRVFSTERRLGRARAWLAERGYDALP